MLNSWHVEDLLVVLFNCLANPIGLAVVQLITPYIVNDPGDIAGMVSCSTPSYTMYLCSCFKYHPQDLKFPLVQHSLSLIYSCFNVSNVIVMIHTHSLLHTLTNTQLWIYAIPAGVTFIITIIAFWYKEPAIPPAPSGDRDHVPSFWRGLLDVVKSWPFWVLTIVWGAGAGIFNAVLTLLPQFLCPYGYSDVSLLSICIGEPCKLTLINFVPILQKESGLWGSLMIFCGLVGATIAGLLIDHTKKFKEITVATLTMAILCLIWFMEVSTCM